MWTKSLKIQIKKLKRVIKIQKNVKNKPKKNLKNFHMAQKV